MAEQLTPSPRLLSAAKFLAAGLLLLRLGGYGHGIAPSAGIFLAILLLLLVYERLHGELAVHGREAALSRWRDWVGRHGFALGLAAITVLALGLRFFALTREFGHLPPNVDENRLNVSILHLFRTGDIDYRTVEHYPGIHYWMLAGTYLFAYVWGLMSDVGRSLGQMPANYFLGFGRAVSALQSTATVVLVGVLGRRLVCARAGLLAALVMALAPLSILVGRQLRNDAAATMLIVAAVIVALGVYRRGFRLWEAALGGALAGLAAGVKYTGVFALLPVLLACALSEDRLRRGQAAGLALAGFLAAALLSNPFVWADIPNLLVQLSDQISITGEGHWAAQDNPAGYHVMTLVHRVLGWPMLLLGAAVLAYHLAAGSKRWWVFAIYPLTSIWFVAQRPSQLPRWVYPEAPFMAVAAAAGLVALLAWANRRFPAVQRDRTRRTVLAALTIIVFLSPMIRTNALNLSLLISTPTWTLTEQWVESNAAQGDRILLDRYWLQLDAARYDLNRQPLDEVLDQGSYELAANDWIVVHEQLFGHAALGNLRRVGRITLDHSFFGTQGPDFFIFQPPEVAPARVPLQVMLAERGARRYLGHEWPSPGSDATRRLPEAGAGLYVPPLGRQTLQLDVIVAPPASGPLPAIDARAGRSDVDVLRTRGDDGSLVFTIELPLRVVGPGVVSVFLRPQPDSGPVDVRGFRLYE